MEFDDFDIDIADSGSGKSANNDDNLKIVYVTNFSDNDFKDFREAFLAAEKTKQTVIPIIVSSNGGDVTNLFAMVDMIKSSKKTIATIVMGKAFSAGGVLAAVGTKGHRYISPMSVFMVHEVQSFSFGNAANVKHMASHIGNMNTTMLELLDKQCGKQIGFWKSLLKANDNVDLVLSASEAKEHGLVDIIGTPRINTKVTIETVLTV